MKYDFKKQLNIDFVKEAENKCISFLKKMNDEVSDVSDNEEYFNLGIDIVSLKYGNIDVKADNRLSETGNLFFELIECFWRDNQYNIKLGWGLNKNINHIFYVDVKNWILYIVDHKKLYDYIYNTNGGKYRMIKHEEYSTIGFLVKIEDIKHIYIKIDNSNNQRVRRLREGR